MSENDFKEFCALLDATLQLNPNWKPLAPAGKAMFFKAMEPYSLEQFRAALNAHVRDPKAGMFQPTPAHLVAQIQAAVERDGRPTADEAWAIALTARDEADTVVWTAETAEALGFCRSILDMGDEVGARRAFIDAYNRLVSEARRDGRRARWSVSAGWDVTRREAAISRAQAAGLLPAPVARELLPNYAPAGEHKDACPEGLKRVKEALAVLQDGWTKAAERRAAAVRAEHERLAALKRDAAERVAEYKRSAA